MSAPTDATAAPRTPEVGLDAERVMAKVSAENFPVASFLLPRRVRAHLLAIYGYCRFVDDVGDLASGDRLAALDGVEAELDATFKGEATAPLFATLQKTVEQLSLDRKPFDDLLAANRLDQHKSRYATWAELVSYCELSANPVGRLVLAVFDRLDERTAALSDDVCTALQLVEHLQDVAEDFAADRVYLPAEDLDRFGTSEADLAAATVTPALRRAIAFEVARARTLLASGDALIGALEGSARVAIAGFVGGGLAQLDAFAAIDFDVLGARAKARPASVLRRSLGRYVAGRAA
jgi:squalene synthase HpnC